MDGSPGNNGLGIGELLTEAAKVLTACPAAAAFTPVAGISSFRGLELEIADAADMLELLPLIHQGINGELVEPSDELDRERVFGALEWFDGQTEKQAEYLRDALRVFRDRAMLENEEKEVE